MKKLLSVLALAAALLSQQVAAQTPAAKDTSWKTGGTIAVNFTQVNLSHWTAGGNDAVSLASNANLFSNYAKGKTKWDNSLILAYGLLKNGSDPVRKSDDQIDLTSKLGFQMGNSKWFYSGLLNFKSQFANGFNYPNDSIAISRFMAPGYLTVALGANYKPVDYFEVFISPVTGKFTFVTDKLLSDAGAFGVDKGKTVRTELGAYLNMKFKKEIMQNVTLSSKLELFDNYTDKDKVNRTRVDVNWQSSLLMKVNKYIAVTFTTDVVYDANVVQRTQFKEVLGVGFNYKF